MVICLLVSIKKIFHLGKAYPWPKPAACPCCHGDRLWGHGFVWAYFDGWPEGLWLKLYRCPDCGAVHRLKPKGYFHRYRVSQEKIRDCLAGRLTTGRWPAVEIGRSRQRHWLKTLRRKVLAYLGQGFARRLLDGFDRLVDMNIIPVGRTI